MYISILAETTTRWANNSNKNNGNFMICRQKLSATCKRISNFTFYGAWWGERDRERGGGYLEGCQLAIFAH